MVVGIHQPIYFPWIGYFDKIAKSDIFVLLDEVQLEKGSYMYRNRILDCRGEISYLTISGDKHGYLDKKYNEIVTTNKETWIPRQKDQIYRAYGESPFFIEVWKAIEKVFDEDKNTICEYAIASIECIVKALDINTRILLQSENKYSHSSMKNDLVLSICEGLGATHYLSGNGAKKYMDESSFENAAIKIRYQQIDVPRYNHINSSTFVPGLSILDMLFTCGIDVTKELFWNNVKKGFEFDE